MSEKSDSAKTESTDTNRPLNKNSGRNGSITDNLGKTTFLKQQTHSKINATEDSHNWPLKDVESPHRKDNRTSWDISEKRYPHIRRLPDVVPAYTNNTNEYSIEKSSFQAIFYDPPPPYRLEKEQSELPEDGRLLTEIKQKHEETHEVVQRVCAVVDNMAKMQEESKRREEENNRNISRMQEAQSSMERTIDDLKTMLQKREEHDEALQQDQDSGIQRHDITSKAGNSFGQCCKKCGCRRLCPCSCHRERPIAENRKDISENIPRDLKRESNDTNKVSETSKDNEICAGRPTVVSDGQLNDVNSDNSDAFAAVYQRDFGGANASGGPPDDPSSGGDDNKDHGDEKGDDRGDRRRRQNTPRKCMWSIDPDAWEQCMKLEKEEDCKQEVESLLKQSKLPGRKSFNEACKRFGRKSDELRKIGNAVCGYLKQKYECIVDVWPGYRCDDKLVNIDVVFVVLTDNLQSIEEENYTLYCRGRYETKTKHENIEIAKRERKDFQKDEELQKLKQVQRKFAPWLMDKHKRLVRVTVSSVKHTAGDMSPGAFKEQLCIAFYVQIRGLVPLDEEAFDKSIEDYQVDVREGLVRLCNKPDDYHDPLKMGCCIAGEKNGSLGPFLMFENRPNSQYALTCAHVLLSKEYLKCVFENGIKEIRDTKKVYQPCITNTEDYFGEVVLAFHSKGTEHSAGMEIGLIHVQSRLPVMGNFPDADFSIAGFERQAQFVLTSNEVLNTLDKSANVFKYGSRTLLTKGTFRTEGSSIRTIPVNNISRDMVLHGQIEVLSVDDIPFAEEGDSGALVMAFSSQSGQMAAVGILEGYFSDYSCYFVTPLVDILEELERIKGTRCFLNKFVNRIETDITFLADRVDNIEKHMEQLKEAQHKQLKQEFSNHTRDINRRLQKLSEEHKEENEKVKSQLQKLSEDQKEENTKVQRQREDQKEENIKINNHLQKEMDEQKEENKNRNNQFSQIMDILKQLLPERSRDETLPENTAGI